MSARWAKVDGVSLQRGLRRKFDLRYGVRLITFRSCEAVGHHWLVIDRDALFTFRLQGFLNLPRLPVGQRPGEKARTNTFMISS